MKSSVGTPRVNSISAALTARSQPDRLIRPSIKSSPSPKASAPEAAATASVPRSPLPRKRHVVIFVKNDQYRVSSWPFSANRRMHFHIRNAIAASERTVAARTRRRAFGPGVS